MIAPKFLALLLCVSQVAQGQSTQQIIWGTDLTPAPVITSDGSALLLTEYTIELGSFGSSFTPTADNITEWVGNWKVFDAVTPETPDGDGFIASGTNDAFFGSSALLNEDRTSSSVDQTKDATFGAGEQGYVFIRNSDVPEGEAEWLLYTSRSNPEWVFPGPFSEELFWFLPDVDEVVWGAVNGDLIGDGSFTDTSDDFQVRTHGFLTSIPEPSVTGLLGLVVLLACSHRKRSK